MKRKLFALIAVFCLVAASILPAQAASAHMVDDAGLLFQSDIRQLEQLLEEVSTRQGMDIVVVTVDELKGKSPMKFADDYYDYNDYGTDGVLLLVSMEENDWWISTSGYGKTAFTDAGMDHMADQFVPLLSDEAYVEAFTLFAQLCDDYITRAKAGDPYDTHNLPKDPFSVGISLLIALAVGLVVALISTGIMRGKLKTVRPQAKADAYVTESGIQLTVSRDLFLYTHLDRRRKPKQSGGSTIHTSSSGTTHGGGGGKF